jgi:hypothetical protein
MILIYRSIHRVYKMLIIATAVKIQQIFHQEIDEQPQTIFRLQKVLIGRHFEGKTKKGLKNGINECIKNDEFFVIHIQPP